MEPRTQEFGPYDFGPIRTLEDYEKYAGISFKKRSIQQYTLDKKWPPNPVLSEEEYEKSWVRIFRHCIDVQYADVPENDYEFWAVAFHRDGDGDTTMFRQDADADDIKIMKRDPDGYCKIWREFETAENPAYWVVWPYSTSKGWCQRLTNRID
jgi:hypothetical protein